MSDDVEKCEDNVESDQQQRREWDCNSSSGGSVYQEFHGRQEEAMYSTDDEFLDATETIRSPLLSEDPEEQLSAPILKQLRQEKEQTRYIVVDMLTDSDSVNNIIEQRKQNVETITKLPCVRTSSSNKKESHCIHSSEEVLNVITQSSDQQNIAGPKTEKNKFSRTLRLPSSVALPTVKPDRPARGDGRPPVGVSKIPIPVSSVTKLQQISTTSEQNSSESESYQTKPNKQSGPKKKPHTPIEMPNKEKETEAKAIPESLNEMNTPESVSCYSTASSVPEPTEPVITSKQSAKPPCKALTRPSSALQNEDKMDTGNENTDTNSKTENQIMEEKYNLPFAPEELIITKDERKLSPEKPRIKRTRSQNKSIEDEQDAFTPNDTSQVNSIKEGAETKRMRVANKPPSREEPEKCFVKPPEPALKDKRKKEIEAVRHRLAKDRLNLINSRERDEVSAGRQCLLVLDNNNEQKTQDSLKSESIQRSASRKSDRGTPQIANRARASPSNAGSEKNIAMPEKVSSSPRQLSPIVMNMSIIEKRRQWRQSREAVNADQKSNTKSSNMLDIKTPLFKSNQLKTNPLGQRHQENVSNAPMKSALEDESLKRKTTLVEKRKMMMKQKEATNNLNKPATGDAVSQRAGKGLERASREKPLLASQKQSNSDIRKQSISKSTEKTAILQPSFTMQEVQEELAGTEVQAKPSTTSTINTKVSLASMHNVYKMHFKRCEEQVSEVKRAKDKLSSNLERLEALRSQMILKFGEDTEDFIPPLYVVESVVQNSPLVMTSARGMNTEVLEEVAESLILLGNNQQLKHDIENLRMQLDEAKEIGYANKKEDDVIADLKQRIREMSLTLALAEKRQETLEEKMEGKQKEIISLNNENKQMNDLSRQRDQQLSALRKQIEEKNRELESVHKKLAEANKNLHEESYNRELSNIEHQKLMEEKNEIEKEMQEMNDRFTDYEEREECLNTILENEKKKNKKLEELLGQKEDELNVMEKKLFEMEASSSSNMMIVNDQLKKKDRIIQELEVMKANLQGQIRELCCLLSDMFALRGIEYNTDHIHSSISAGSIPQLKEELMKVMEERIEEGNKAINEARSKIVELQNQVKILQIELEDSKMMSERLSNVITHQKPWDADKPWEDHQRPWSSDMASARHAVHNSIIENSLRDNKSFRDGDIHSLMPSIASSFVCSDATMARNNFNELFGLLERKRRQLLQLERKYQDMEEVHSHCAQKRSRNETRIAQLEMMLA
ncbi:unnamed protein product [Nezara viridula]|uniref:Uncharacterized protein n=1 Tax=Nezara viridula TaxID=85310 RepID=A0A9P0E4R3_NEZVI|nr:unnamed protein product [Nezara viridula]